MVNFSAKELDNETGYSYFGARYYDSDLSSWLSVDPMSDKYPSLSPYIYTANNPINFVDPNGMLIDEYELNKKTGEIKWINDNKHYDIDGNEVDKLFSNKGKSINVSKGVLGQKQIDPNKYQSYGFLNSNEAEEFYFFVADYSDVEWAHAEMKSGSGYVGTNNSNGSTYMTTLYEDAYGSSIARLSHSHPAPGGPPSYNIWKKDGRTGDLNNLQKSKYDFQREVYDVSTCRIYGYDKSTTVPHPNSDVKPVWNYVKRRYYE